MMPINSHYNEELVQKAIASALESFYNSLIEKIDTISISSVVSSKNPYLYRAKAMKTASEIVDSIMQAYTSSSEETIFGNLFFEPIALAASNGQKSIAEGVDMDIIDSKNNTLYAIAVKSGTSVFNADSKKRQEENFTRARKLAQQGHYRFEAIIGYGYGTKQDSGRGKATIYQELAGEEFWTAITGDPEFYKKIIIFMGQLPDQYISQYNESYAKASNRLIKAFTEQFCTDDGSIDWDKLVDFNSGSPVRKKTEAFHNDMKLLAEFLLDNPTSSKKAMQELTGFSSTKLNRVLNALIADGFVSQQKVDNKLIWVTEKEFS